MKQRALNIVTVALFALALLAVPLYWLLCPRKTFSETERRYLAEPPKLTSLKDWSFDDAVETYLADQLPGRDALVGLDAYTVLLSGRQVSEDIWMDREGYLVEAPVKASPEQLDKRLGRMAALGEKTGLPVYVMAVPSTGYVRRGTLPKALAALYPDGDLLGRIEDAPGVTVVPLENEFLQSGQGWYYRTDHHWTGEGAYAAYRLFMKTAGREALDYDRFYHHTVPGYVGSTRSRSALWLTKPDVLTMDEPMDAPVTVTFSDDEKAYDSLFFLDHLTEYDWYPLFLDGNHPVSIVENRSAPDGPTLLMVKDSFGNTLAPLLVPSYGKIVLVDPRYYRGSVAELCAEQGADEILFCYSLERICTDLNLSILK
ncbi:MAG: hypothetical protein IJI82_06405 [Clostridia bacterium]|nr:hypothetical protein [Clostridia bacterium]